MYSQEDKTLGYYCTNYISGKVIEYSAKTVCSFHANWKNWSYHSNL